MSDAFTYPGVYIFEAPSVVHTIVGVPTAITAFVGAAARGPLNEPKAIQSAADYGRHFGGDGTMPLDRAVTLFFQNGGADAIVVRVGADQGPNAMPVAKATICSQPVAAASPGAWGANITYTVDQKGFTASQTTTLYNLILQYSVSGSASPPMVEVYPRVSTDSTSPRSLPRLLASSSLVVIDTSATTPPPQTAASTKSKAAATTGTDDSSGDGATAPSDASVIQVTDPTKPAPSFKVSGGSTDTPATEADLYSAENDQIGFPAVVKHNTFFNLLVITPIDSSGDVQPTTLAAAAAFVRDHRAMLLVDTPTAWSTVDAAVLARDDFFTPFGAARDNAAAYFPRLTLSDSDGNPIVGVGPSGAIAGLYATTDRNRGVWKAPAGIAVQLSGPTDLAIRMSDSDNGQLNPVAVNCLRSLPVIGDVVWGARTMNGDDLSASQWKYIPVRRLALYIEESLYRGTQWVVFEPNDEPLWAQVRLNVGAFMHTLFRQGAFQGKTAKDAYFVKCDSDTNPQVDIDNGILNVVVGFAPLRPAEFVVLTIQQITDDIQV